MTAHRARARRLIVMTLVLVLAGAGAAAAYWTATTQLSTTASSAAVGLEQTMLPREDESPLGVTFTAETTAAAGAVALTNTGSRAAEYTLTVDTTSTSTTALPSALHLAAGALAADQECSTGTSLETTGTGAEPLTLTGALEAGATIDLCLRTTLSAESIAAHPEQKITLSLTSSLRYAEGDAWTVTAGPSTITQTVGPRESAPEQPSTPGTGDFVSDGARYMVRLDGGCIQRTEMEGSRGLALQTACGEWESQWRLTDMGDGTFTLDWATNQQPGSLAQTRWTANGTGTSVMLTDSRENDAAQRWRVSASTSDRYRFESVAHPGQFLTVGDGLWDRTDSATRRLTLEPAGEVTAQSFVIDRVGTPFRELEEMTPQGSGPWNLDLTFSANIGYERELTYRVFLTAETAPDVRFPYPLTTLTGESRNVQFTSASVMEYFESAEGGYGNVQVHVEQQLPGGEWTPAAVGKIHIAPATSQDPTSVGVYPGWK